MVKQGVSVAGSARGTKKASSTDEAPLGPTGRPYHGFPTPPKLDSHGPARIISLCNQKGGVGKTTTTINLAASLAHYGRRVLVVDFDPQGALSAGLGIATHDIPTVYDLLLDTKRDPREIIVASRTEGLDVLPANIDLSAAEVHLVNEVARETILARVLRHVSREYDVILVDWRMHDGSGVDLYKWVLKNKPHLAARVVFLAEADQDDSGPVAPGRPKPTTSTP